MSSSADPSGLLALGTPDGRKRALIASVVVCALSALAYLLVDRPIATWVDEVLPDSIRRGARSLGHVTDGHQIIAVLALGALAGRLARRPTLMRRILLVMGAVGIAAIAVVALKFAFGRARPEEWVKHGIFGFGGLDAPRFRAAYNGFPSGHASAYGALARAAWLAGSGPWRWMLGFVLLALAAGRVLANKHFLGDVIAGLFVGVIVADTLWSWLGARCAAGDAAVTGARSKAPADARSSSSSG